MIPLNVSHTRFGPAATQLNEWLRPLPGIITRMSFSENQYDIYQERAS